MPYGVAAAGDWLLAADTANSRLIGWHCSELNAEFDLNPLHDAPADGLLGQVTYRQKGENRDYGSALRDSFCWPYGIQVCGDIAVIADSGNNRVMLWRLEVGVAGRQDDVNSTVDSALTGDGGDREDRGDGEVNAYAG